MWAVDEGYKPERRVKIGGFVIDCVGENGVSSDGGSYDRFDRIKQQSCA